MLWLDLGRTRRSERGRDERASERHRPEESERAMQFRSGTAKSKDRPTEGELEDEDY